ncbi:RIBOFLAVIN SYNTHASE ALPHA CHAIN [Salix koriyanagi]|uniref:RIBOFLAVIN SYNTHASE ALPHA CHAIN n=1 Tax=Salix koriyanagi TaxID=2511006 RepID=A0A9Q1A4Y6_9ROSI|nr:RIBOFLAVIN SYNTHASE ALPHA CHAIN [Salix koriyanagi]
MGKVQNLGDNKDGGVELKIGAETVLEGVNLGDSIAVNGTCLTVTDFTNQDFTVGLSPETLRKTSLIELKIGSLVNLERAVQPISRMGRAFCAGSRGWHGCDCGEVDGTSLTVVDVFEEEGCFNFMLVSYTQQKIVVPLKEVGQKVNLEVDILGKYVERLLSSRC